MSQLKAQNISVTFPGSRGAKRVLEPLNITMSKGESVVVVGPSGCGKSTLLNVLAGFQPSDDGQVSINQQVMTGSGGSRGVVFQDDALMPWLNAKKNVALGLKFKGLSRQERNHRADKMLHMVGLSEFSEQYPDSLSGGQRQRLGLARALAVEPDFLFLDEPFGALDALTRERMQALLLELWKLTGKGIFLITHSIDEALLLSTDLIVMAGPPGQIIEHIKPGFAERFIKGDPLSALRHDPRFETLRHKINTLLIPDNVDADITNTSSRHLDDLSASANGYAGKRQEQENPHGTI